MIQIVQQTASGMAHPKGHPSGLVVPNHASLFSNLGDILKALGDEKTNLYYTLAHHADLGKPHPSRKEATFEYQAILPFDIDHCDATRSSEYTQVVAGILGVDQLDLTVVATGNGLHILSNLATPIRSAKFQKELKPTYNEIIRRIAVQLEVRGLPGKPDPVVFDCARVFRLPGTINRKPNAPDKECTLIQYSAKSHAIDLKQLSGLDKLEKENVSPAEIRRNFPKPDFQEIVKECRFVAWAMEKPQEVHEPQIFDLFSILGAQPPEAKALYLDRELSPREIGASIMEHATASASLARQDFDRKWDDSSRYGARKCSTISAHWPSGCETCPHFNRIPTPLALKSDAHIGSEDNGYWVLGSKGQHLHPNYSDLSKIYLRERAFIVTEKERLFNFQDGHYTESAMLPLKSWLERKVEPSDPLRDMHCNEFVKKVQRVGAMTKAAEKDLFVRSTTGKLNCRNGALDILTGELIPHDPKLGFQYVLPYDYIPDAPSEVFIDWLATITEDRVELMDVILDMMAYCLWPTYDDHVFFCLVGTGANGKSTLIHIIQSILGEGNFSTVSMQQLGANRFAPASLEGKLANLSEESSGYEMNHEELNVLKNLSAGGKMYVERKGIQGYEFHNKAKLIFSANKPPRFKETGHALTRRMVVIPFDFIISTPDSNIEERLVKEAPGIVSMLIRRIQANILKHDNRFKCSRGAEVTAEAQRKVLLNGNSVVEWAKEAVESKADMPLESCIEVSDGYHKYKEWCEENRYRAVNRGIFGHQMHAFVITSAVDKEDNRVRVAGKQIRVFKRTKWKEDHV